MIRPGIFVLRFGINRVLWGGVFLYVKEANSLDTLKSGMALARRTTGSNGM